MSVQTFDDACKGCKPAMLDVKTGQMLPDDSPQMKIVLRVWSTLPIAEKQAWHRFTCLNSRTLLDVQIAKTFTDAVQDALTKADGE